MIVNLRAVQLVCNILGAFLRVILLTQSPLTGYDGLHPNAWGEYLIASAFSNTLVNSLNMGSNTITTPPKGDPNVGKSLDPPANFKGFSSPQGVTATWDHGRHLHLHLPVESLHRALLISTCRSHGRLWL